MPHFFGFSAYIAVHRGAQQRLHLYRADGGHAPGTAGWARSGYCLACPREDEEMQAEHREIEVDTLAATVRDDLDFAEDMSSSLEVVLRGYAMPTPGAKREQRPVQSISSSRARSIFPRLFRGISGTDSSSSGSL